MRPPYFRVTAFCRNPRCSTAEFSADRKHVVKTGTGGQSYTIENLVCPQCKAWGRINKIEEMTAC